jgi:hypothetical protein
MPLDGRSATKLPGRRDPDHVHGELLGLVLYNCGVGCGATDVTHRLIPFLAGHLLAVTFVATTVAIGAYNAGPCYRGGS